MREVVFLFFNFDFQQKKMERKMRKKQKKTRRRVRHALQSPRSSKEEEEEEEEEEEGKEGKGGTERKEEEKEEAKVGRSIDFGQKREYARRRPIKIERTQHQKKKAKKTANKMKRIEIKGGPARGSGPPLISLLLLFFISLCLVGSVCEITFQLAKIKFQKQKKTKTNGTPKFGTTPVRDLFFFFSFFF